MNGEDGGWFVRHVGQEKKGPFTFAALVELAGKNRVESSVVVWHETQTQGEWVPALNFEPIASSQKLFLSLSEAKPPAATTAAQSSESFPRALLGCAALFGTLFFICGGCAMLLGPPEEPTAEAVVNSPDEEPEPVLEQSAEVTEADLLETMKDMVPIIYFDTGDVALAVDETCFIIKTRPRFEACTKEGKKELIFKVHQAWREVSGKGNSDVLIIAPSGREVGGTKGFLSDEIWVSD